MPQNFIGCDRDRAFLMPPSFRDWLPADHLAWFVIETVEQLDLDVFYADYRADGHGRAAYDPSMMVSPVLFAYSTGERVLTRDRASLPSGHRVSRDHG
jgi:hypothetical protein